MRFLVACAMAWLATALAPAAGVEPLPAQFMPSSELRPGMVGEGRTVFQGFKVETFKATILGVRHNALPGSNMIMAKLEGPMLAGHGVVAGMSGSPVYVNGRLIGAVAYGWSFAYEPLCGITPIESMWQVWRDIGQPGLQKQKPRSSGPAPLSAPWDWQAQWQAYQGLGQDKPQPAVTIQGSEIAGLPAGELRPLMTPLFVSGVSAPVMRQLSGIFKSHNLELVDAGPLAGGAAATESAEPAPALEPGSAIGVPMLYGELNVAGVGTVTWRDGDKLIGFGHPMMGAGGVKTPLSAAYIISFMQSYERSFKLGEVRNLVGTMDQDRTYAIGGTLGEAPPFIPINVTISGPAASDPRVYRFKAWKDADFLPAMAMVALDAAWTSGGGGTGEMTLTADSTIRLAGGRTIRKHILSSADNNAVGAAVSQVLFDLFALMQNPFEEADVASIDVSVDARVGRRDQIELVSVTPEHNRYLAGDTVRMQARLRQWRGPELTRSIELKLPKPLKAGNYTIQLVDAGNALNVERSLRPAVFAPRQFDDVLELVDAMNVSPDQLRLYLIDPTSTTVLKGRELGPIPSTMESLVRETAPAQVQQQAAGTALDMRMMNMEAPVQGSANIAIQIVDHFNE